MRAIASQGASIKTTEQPSQAQTICVWDLGVRLFHWLLVISVSMAALTGFFAPEWWLEVHIWAGYAVSSLIVCRVIWGFFGSGPARFSSFIFSLHEVLAHTRNFLNGKPKHYTGHNPLGALMVFGLLAVLSLIVLSGMVGLGGQENQGFLSGFITFWKGEAALWLHEALSLCLLFMIAGHVIGVIVESVLSRTNLIRSMITGAKEAHNFTDKTTLTSASIPAALLVLIAAFALIGLNVWDLSRRPASGLITMKPNSTYLSECGDCHHAYHPSLLPAASWQKMMAGLEDHFGEDASLDAQAVSSITGWLNSFSAKHWDTEAANNLRQISSQEPLRITASPYWLRRHQNIGAATFNSKAVNSKGNCIACHEDAVSGRFDDQKIRIPTKSNTIRSSL